MQKTERCLRAFPDDCEGCPEYREKHYDSTLPLISMTTLGFIYPSQNKNTLIKECKLYHKRKIEPLT